MILIAVVIGLYCLMIALENLALDDYKKTGNLVVIFRTKGADRLIASVIPLALGQILDVWGFWVGFATSFLFVQGSWYLYVSWVEQKAIRKVQEQWSKLETQERIKNAKVIGRGKAY